MAQKYANAWSQAAASLTALSHTHAGVFRWGVLIVLTAVWFVGGLWLWRDQPTLGSVLPNLQRCQHVG
jgi:hypothetical protein